MDKNKRSHLRVDTTVSVINFKIIPSNVEFKNIICRNLSGGGMLLLMDKKIDIDSDAEFDIKLPGAGSELIHGKGKIVSVQEASYLHDSENRISICYTIGVKFVRMAIDDRKRIIAFVYELIKKMDSSRNKDR